VFTAGIILGGLAFAATFQSGLVTSSLYEPGTTGQLYEVAGVTLWTTNVQPWRLFLGGILVGVGTRIGKGLYVRPRRLWRRLGVEDLTRRRPDVPDGGDRDGTGRRRTGVSP